MLPSAMIFTDEWFGYNPDRLGKRYKAHHRIRKNGIRGVYHFASSKYLQSYLDEHAWRYHHRQDPKPMFWTILDQVQKASPAGAKPS